jgi:hypothetical protein
MTEEYARKARQQSRDYAVLSYRLPYVGKSKHGYLDEGPEGEEQPNTPQIEDRYKLEANYPLVQHRVEAVSVTLIRHYIRLRKIVG